MLSRKHGIISSGSQEGDVGVKHVEVLIELDVWVIKLLCLYVTALLLTLALN